MYFLVQALAEYTDFRIHMPTNSVPDRQADSGQGPPGDANIPTCETTWPEWGLS